MDTKPIAVLLIEDDADDVVLIQRYLSNALKVPFRMKHADRLSKGLECLTEGGFDVVLLDLGLPDGRGLGTFEMAHARAPHVPIIVLTGHNDDETAIEAVQKGAQDYLVKYQVSGDILRRSIRYAIERQKLLTQIEHSTREIKTLRGFLPICASCKKIRDDTGYWTQIEAYISKHSEAEFSHGICPDCATKLYGDRVFAIVQRYETMITDAPKFEHHKKHIDVQYIVSGEEIIGWAPMDMMAITEVYDADRDIGFGTVVKGRWTPLLLQAGQVAVLYPEDGHAPKLAAHAPSAVLKIVVKGAVG